MGGAACGFGQEGEGVGGNGASRDDVGGILRTGFGGVVGGGSGRADYENERLAERKVGGAACGSLVGGGSLGAVVVRCV